MKSFSMLAFAASAIASVIAPRGDYDHGHGHDNGYITKTMTTYTTTTVCPTTKTIEMPGT